MTKVFQNNRTSLLWPFIWFRETEFLRPNILSYLRATELSSLDHFHGPEKQSSAVWTGFIEQTTSVSPWVRREHWAVRPRLGAVLKRSSQAAFRLSDLLFRAEYCKTEQDIGLQSGSGGQFGLAKFALWRDSTSPGQAVCSYWRTSASCSNFQFWSQGNRWNRVIVIVPVLKLNPWYPVLWAEPVLLQRMTSSRQGKPEKESLVQGKANWFDDQKSAFL